MRRLILATLMLFFLVGAFSCSTLRRSVDKQIAGLNAWGKTVVQRSLTDQEILLAVRGGEPFGTVPERISRDEDGLVLFFNAYHILGKILQYSLQIAFESKRGHAQAYRVFLRGFETMEERTE